MADNVYMSGLSDCECRNFIFELDNFIERLMTDKGDLGEILYKIEEINKHIKKAQSNGDYDEIQYLRRKQRLLKVKASSINYTCEDGVSCSRDGWYDTSMFNEDDRRYIEDRDRQEQAVLYNNHQSKVIAKDILRNNGIDCSTSILQLKNKNTAEMNDLIKKQGQRLRREIQNCNINRNESNLSGCGDCCSSSADVNYLSFLYSMNLLAMQCE